MRLVSSPGLPYAGLLNQKNKLKLQAIVNVCCKVSGTTLNDLPQLNKLQVLRKVQSILRDPRHTRVKEFKLLLKGLRYRLRLPACRTNRLKHFFVTVALGLLNK